MMFLSLGGTAHRIDSTVLDYAINMTASDQHSSRTTLADVARLAGVSVSTASIAFSGSGPISLSTRERVLAAAAELGYDGPDPRARSLRQGRSGVIGIVLESRLRYAFRDPVTSITLDGIAEGLGGESNGLLLLTDTGAGDATIETAAVDAVVLLSCSRRFDRSIEVLRRRGIPVVSIEGPPRPELVEITLDNREASTAAAEYLRGLGHERVGIVALPTAIDVEPRFIGADTPIAIEVTRARLAGARSVYPDAPAHSTWHNTPEDGLRATLQLLAGPDADRPTAIIAQADLLAVGAIRAIEELGLRVPEDISVIGFDGIRIDGLEHDLTTMVQPANDKGQAAGRVVAELLVGSPGTAPAPAHPLAFTCTLHRGTTTAPPPSFQRSPLATD
jgi:DNA-binding LacI/PurR family transcriptional regulator